MRLHGRQHQLFIAFFLALLLQSSGVAQVLPADGARKSWQHASEAGRAAQWGAYHSQQARLQPHRSEYALLAWQWKAYETQQMQWAAYYQQQEKQTASRPAMPQPTMPQPAASPAPPVMLRNGFAYGLSTLPHLIHRLLGAANALQNKPYLLGGGHRRLDDVGYDCSSATSYVLIKAGLLQAVLNSSQLAGYGEPGPGRFITLWVKSGHHVFLTICGLRLDTSGGRVSEGPRWRTAERSLAGFMPRHPPGL